MAQECDSQAFQRLLYDVLANAKCLDLVVQQKVAIIDADMDVTQACQLLVKNGISSAPVYDSGTQSYIGMIDYRDLVDYLLIICLGKGPDDFMKSTDPKQALTWESILSKAFAGEPVKARLATDLSRKNPFYSLLPESTLLTAVEVMRTGIHRVNIMSAEDKVIGVLSQTDIIRFLLSSKEIAAALADMKIGDLKVCQSPAIFIRGDDILLEALKEMSYHGLSSVAVVDNNDKLLGNLSMADVKYLFKKSNMEPLWTSCVSFISEALSEQGLEQGKDRYPFFDVSLSASMSLVMRKLVATKAHRIWVADKDGKLIGVISMTDILYALCPKCVDAPGKCDGRPCSGARE